MRGTPLHFMLVAISALVMLAACTSSSLLPPRRTALSVASDSRSLASEGGLLQMDIYRPKGIGAHAAAIVLHGSGGIHFVVPSTANQYAQSLAAQGIYTVVLHYFDGTGNYTANDSVEIVNYAHWVTDVKNAITWMRTQPEVQKTHIGLVGISLGAWLAVGVASEDMRVNRIVLFGGGLEPFLREKITRMPPVLMFHGSDDDVVPQWEADSLASFLQTQKSRVRYHVVEGEEHNFSDSTAIAALVESARFLKRRRGAR